jgi:hypothetical protein
VPNVDELISALDEMEDCVGSSSWKWNTPELKRSTDDNMFTSYKL